MVYLTNYHHDNDEILLASDGENIIGLWFKDQKYYGGKLIKDGVYQDDLKIFEDAKKWLDAYFKGEQPSLSDLKIKFYDSEFRHLVWQELCLIPYGQTISYKEIGLRVAKKMNRVTMSAQAVGGAVGHNPISIIVPCHRVVASNKSLTGYAGGLERKIKLLKLEGIDPNDYSCPTKGSAI